VKIVIKTLTEENLVEVPEWESHPFSCKYCIYWEHPELCLDPATEKKEEVFQKKLAWLRHVKEQFVAYRGILYLEDKAVGFAQSAPPRFPPAPTRYPAGPAREDAVLISCLFIPAKEHRGQGLGSLLLRDILEELQERGIKAVETFARKGSSENPARPLEFCLKHGFRIHRDDEEFPLVRLTL